MLQRGTVVKVADNSGAKTAKIIGIPGYSNRKTASLGDVVVLAVKSAIPRGNVKNHEVVNGVIVRVKKEYRRDDGTYVRFDDNAVVILDKNKKDTKGTRVFGPIARELKDAGFDKIISLAPEVL